MKLLMVTPRFPPFVGGTEAHVFEVSKRLAVRGHDVHVVTTVLDRAQVGVRTEHGVHVQRILARPSSSDMHFSTRIPGAVKDVGADVIHVQGYHTLVAPLALSAAHRSSTPFLVTFHSGGHSSAWRRAIRPVQQRLMRRQLSRATALIGVSEFETEFFRDRLDLPRSHFETIANGVDQEFIDVPRATGSGPPTIASVGRLVEYKGHQRTIAALPAIRRHVDRARLRIVGSGSYAHELESLASRLGVGDAVDFVSVPYGDRLQLAEEMAAASVLTFLSSYESQGIAGFEAIATGARLVVSDSSALRELASFPGVEVVSHLDTPAIAAAVTRQLQSPPLETRSTVPTWSDTTDALEMLYRRAVHARPDTARQTK